MNSYLEKLNSQASRQSEKLDRILDWITCQSQTSRPADSERTNENESWASRTREAENTVKQLREEIAKLTKQFEETSRQKEDAIRESLRLKSVSEDNAETIQKLREETARLEKMLSKESETVKHLTEENARLASLSETVNRTNQEDYVVKELKSENARLVALVEAAEKHKNAIHLVDEKLLIYQSKCAELESRLLEIQDVARNKDQQVKELQQENEKLARDATEARDLADALQLTLDKSKAEKPTGDGNEVEERVKTIMNKTYKQAMKQFRPEQSYSFDFIKSSLSGVIRVSLITITWQKKNI